MLKVDLYNLKAVKGTTQLTLPSSMEEKENMSLLAQAVHVYRDRMHTGSTKSKTRAEVNRTTKKVYKQKGTGGARHGSRRAPIYVGGGTAHGPKLESRTLSLSQKMRVRALSTAISLKVKAGEVFAVEGLGNVKKTKDVSKLVTFGRKILVLADNNSGILKTVKNLKDTRVVLFRDLNAYDVLMGGKLVLDSSIFAAKESKATKTAEVKPVKKAVAAKKTVVTKAKKETTKK